METKRIKKLVLYMLAVWAFWGPAPTFGVNDPIAHWGFDEGTGGTAFDSVSTNHGVVYGPNWTTGVLDGALDFNGVDDYVRVADDPALDVTAALTLSAWIKTPGGGRPCIICKYNSQNGTDADDSYNLRIDDVGRVTFDYKIGSTYVIKTSTLTVADDSWHHVASVYTGSVGRIYIDGNEAPLSRSDPDPGGAVNASAEDLFIGCFKLTGSLARFFNGKIDDVRIYDRALSAGEIWTIYDPEVPMPIAHWGFDEGTGGTAFDSVGTNHGVVYGPNWTTGVLDGALDFNGVDDYVLVNDDPSLDGMDALTLSAWVKTPGGGTGGVISKFNHQNGVDTDDSYGLRVLDTGKVDLLYKIGSTYVHTHSVPTVTDDSWHHIVGVYTGSAGRIYIDGNEVPLSRDDPDPGGPVNESTDDLLIGCVKKMGSLEQFFNGKIDNVRIYDRALYAGEIQQLYEQQLPAPIAHWKLDEGGGIVAYDSVGTNHGVVYGPNWTTGVLDGALDFNGVDDYVQVDDAPGLDGMDQLTLSAWVKTPGNGVGVLNKYLLEDGMASTDSYNMRLHSDGSVIFQYSLGSTYVAKFTAMSITDDSWHHIVAVYDGVDGIIYVDGNEAVLSRDDPDPGGPINESNEPVLVGCANYQGSLDQFFEGRIDDARIYDQALSAGAVLQLYQNVVGGPNEPNEPNEPGGIYYVDGVSGSDLYDGLSLETAFATIQKGIDTADDGNTVLVHPAVYSEALNLSGKAIALQGVVTATGAPVIEAPGDPAVTCYSGEDSNTVLEHFVIRNSEMAAFVADASPTLRYMTVVDNDFGIAAYGSSDPDISNCIFWNNTDGHVYGCVARWACAPDPNDPNVSPVGLAAHWKLDETSGTVADDSSGNGHIGNLKGGLSFDHDSIPGPSDNALDFDGANDYIKAPTVVAPTSALTMAMWIRPNSDLNAASARMDLLHWGDPIQRPALIFNFLGNGKIGLHVKIDGQTYDDIQTTTSSWQASRWYHVAVTFNGIDFKVYLDGDPEDTVAHPGTHGWTSELYIGRHRNGGLYWDGAMDDVRMYTRALTAEEIQRLYQGGPELSPQFADAAGGDYHLKSERGRYWPQYNVWVLDDISSPCIDLGDPMVDPSNEQMPNGGQLNAGVYGNTPYASMSEWPIPEDHNRDGIVNWLDAASLAAKWLEMLDWFE
jgi:hypothetical protein